MSTELKKIMVVDDDKDILTIVKYSLDPLKEVTILCVTSGQEAVQQALTQKPDLILLDIMMPDMDGLATLQVLKSLPDLASIPVLFLTAKAQLTEIEHYLSLNILGVITKPFDPITLPDEILNYWNQHLKKCEL